MNDEVWKNECFTTVISTDQSCLYSFSVYGSSAAENGDVQKGMTSA
jgi:hypothetical protein